MHSPIYFQQIRSPNKNNTLLSHFENKENNHSLLTVRRPGTLVTEQIFWKRKIRRHTLWHIISPFCYSFVTIHKKQALSLPLFYFTVRLKCTHAYQELLFSCFIKNSLRSNTLNNPLLCQQCVRNKYLYFMGKSACPYMGTWAPMINVGQCWTGRMGTVSFMPRQTNSARPLATKIWTLSHRSVTEAILKPALLTLATNPYQKLVILDHSYKFKLIKTFQIFIIIQQVGYICFCQGTVWSWLS